VIIIINKIDMSNKNKTVTYIVIAIIVAGGVGFWGGTAFGKSRGMMRDVGTRQGMQFGMGTRGGFTGRGGMNGGFVGGEIVNKDDASITVKLPNNGGTKIVLLSGSTQVLKAAQGTLADLAVGSQVTITGTPNSDGSITATMVQMRPAGAQPVRPQN
jgi:hypothetical protein